MAHPVPAVPGAHCVWRNRHFYCPQQLGRFEDTHTPSFFWRGENFRLSRQMMAALMITPAIAITMKTSNPPLIVWYQPCQSIYHPRVSWVVQKLVWLRNRRNAESIQKLIFNSSTILLKSQTNENKIHKASRWCSILKVIRTYFTPPFSRKELGEESPRENV